MEHMHIFRFKLWFFPSYEVSAVCAHTNNTGEETLNKGNDESERQKEKEKKRDEKRIPADVTHNADQFWCFCVYENGKFFFLHSTDTHTHMHTKLRLNCGNSETVKQKHKYIQTIPIGNTSIICARKQQRLKQKMKQKSYLALYNILRCYEPEHPRWLTTKDLGTHTTNRYAYNILMDYYLVLFTAFAIIYFHTCYWFSLRFTRMSPSVLICFFLLSLASSLLLLLSFVFVLSCSCVPLVCDLFSFLYHASRSFFRCYI